MKTLKEFYDYILKLTPMSETKTPHNAHPTPIDGVAIGIYSGHTQANIIDTETGFSMVNVCFHPEEDDANIYKVDPKNGCADYGDPFTVKMDDSIDEFRSDLRAKFGVFTEEILTSVLGSLKPIDKLDEDTVNPPIYLVCTTNNMNPDSVKILGGRLVNLKQNHSDGKVMFIDAKSGDHLWLTSKATVERDACNDGEFLTLKTQTSEYRLLSINSSFYQTIQKIKDMIIESSSSMKFSPEADQE